MEVIIFPKYLKVSTFLMFCIQHGSKRVRFEITLTCLQILTPNDIKKNISSVYIKVDNFIFTIQ